MAKINRVELVATDAIVKALARVGKRPGGGHPQKMRAIYNAICIDGALSYTALTKLREALGLP